MSRPEKEYAEACDGQGWRILGAALRPFSLGHRLLLEQLDSPFVTGARAPEIADLQVGLWVCSRSYEEGRRAMRKGLGPLWWLHAWLVKLRGIIKPIETRSGIAAFVRYIRIGSAMPEVWAGQGGRAPGAPLAVILKTRLMSELGYTPEHALNMPLAQAHWELLALREMSGGLEFPNELERDVLARRRATAAAAPPSRN